jgi:hypothetical protein
MGWALLGQEITDEAAPGEEKGGQQSRLLPPRSRQQGVEPRGAQHGVHLLQNLPQDGADLGPDIWK